MPASSSPSVLLLLSSPQVDVVRSSLRDTGDGAVPVRVAASAREALGQLLTADQPPGVLILQAGADGQEARALRAAVADPFCPTRLMLVPEGDQPPARHDILEALRPVPAAMGAACDPAFLRRGLEKGGIGIRYQPIVRAADRRPVRLEALARWDMAPDFLTPGMFVPMAERFGFGRDLSMSVVHRGLCGLARLRRTAPRLRALQLSVNLPLETLVSHDLPGWLAAALGRHPLRPRDLAIELTETTPVRDSGPLRRALLRLRRAGHDVLIDDLGLQDGRDWLLDLPFTGVKLDRSLVLALPGSARARRELGRVARRARRRGLRVIAEGISSASLWRVAASLGVDEMQGFAIGRPMLAEVLPDWASHWLASGLAEGASGA